MMKRFYSKRSLDISSMIEDSLVFRVLLAIGGRSPCGELFGMTREKYSTNLVIWGLRFQPRRDPYKVAC